VSDGFRLGLFYTIVRPEERSLLEAAERRGLGIERLHDEALTFDLAAPESQANVVLNRSVSHSRALYAARFFEHYGVPTVNPSAVVEVSGDKVLASIRFHDRGIPTPRTIVALTPEAALRALDEVGYPAVLKPPIGSWGRLMAKVESRREAEQILEHKSALASPQHSVFYVQEYVPKPGRDLRVLVVGEEVVAAMYRYSDDWRTNAARGGTTEALVPTSELGDLALQAARAVGGGVLAVDLMESPHGLVVHEVNPTPEFKALTAATHIDVADRIVSYAVEQGRR
jgi:[lysine-biosynthesis-protein LysW]---L-2-aminoadipate ligase